MSNPFSNVRTEHEKDLHKLYIVPPITIFDPTNPIRPLVVVGGRGTGKTIFFMCNSWKERFHILCSEDSSMTYEKMIEQDRVIGLYYKVDEDFIYGMNDEKEYEGLFNTYLSVVLLQELFGLLEALVGYKENMFDIQSLLKAYNSLTDSKLDVNSTIRDLQEGCDHLLKEVENTINKKGDNYERSLRYTFPGTILYGIVKELKNCQLFKDVTIKIYIDEHEGFNEWQQKRINTLIKKSDHVVSYSIGLKPNGIRTRETISGQKIQDPDDYRLVDLDLEFFGEDDDKKFKKHIEKIAEKRIEEYNLAHHTSANSDIKFYLGKYDFDKEVASLFKKREKFKFVDVLKTQIQKQCESLNKDSDEYVRILCNEEDNTSLLCARINLSILSRKGASVEDIFTKYKEWLEKGKETKYKDIYHNTKTGALFLLLSETNVRKEYYGFDTYLSLSSGAVRPFIDLCYKFFSLAEDIGYSIEDISNKKDGLGPKDFEHLQSKAAYIVSSRYAEDLKKNEETISGLANGLGKIFQAHHKGMYNTLAEPEMNHFTYMAGSVLSEEAEKNLESAMGYAVIKKRKSTKLKVTSDITPYDFYLNRLLAPKFQISVVKKRKKIFDSEDLNKIFSNDTVQRENSIMSIIKVIEKNNQSQDKQQKKSTTKRVSPTTDQPKDKQQKMISNYEGDNCENL